MSDLFEEDKEFKGISFSENRLEKGVYENCTFLRCAFLNSDLSDIIFIECGFKECDLSMSNLSGVSMQGLSFTECKLVGLHFELCSDLLFSASFKNCDLKLSSFYKSPLKRSGFFDCKLNEADFTESNMTGSVIKGCDLTGAIFNHTILEEVDLRMSTNYSIDPHINRIRKAKFSVEGVIGLLDKHDILIE